MSYFKIILKDDDWFIINQNDLYRCIKMLDNNLRSYQKHEWKHINENKNKFLEFTPETYLKWLNKND